MPAKPPLPDPQHSRTMSDEADIGSGEQNSGQPDTDAIIGQIPPLPGTGGQPRQNAAPGDKAGGGDKGQPGEKPRAQP